MDYRAEIETYEGREAMSKPTIEEMLDCLDEMKRAYGHDDRTSSKDVQRVSLYADAIRALILAVGEWKRRVEQLGDGIEFIENRTVADILMDIRDFGEEEK